MAYALLSLFSFFYLRRARGAYCILNLDDAKAIVLSEDKVGILGIF
jgi:hypothetical protein